MNKRTHEQVRGIDVSHWQGPIDWTAVKQEGIDFVFIKATEGHTFIDPMLKENVEGAREVGLQTGLYHFARFTNEEAVYKEIHHFVNTTESFYCDLPFVLDLETTNGLEKNELSRLATMFLKGVNQKVKCPVMIYTNTNFAKRYMGKEMAEFPLWIAHYGKQKPGVNGVWDDWNVFQYTNRGRVNGISGSVDLNVMNSTKPIEQNSSQVTLSTMKRKKVHTYKIKRGDTFWGLETRFSLPRGTLTNLNPTLNPHQLSVGQSIVVPNRTIGAYRIKLGDTFWELEEANGWKAGTLEHLNPDVNPLRLQIGETIKVPVE